jgi:hypothetical protein
MTNVKSLLTSCVAIFLTRSHLDNKAMQAILSGRNLDKARPFDPCVQEVRLFYSDHVRV